ncbi:hypothetical protein NDU88_004829 [Pleurodeles waltl]|uniref:Uncharacterized protein n=1 Tax=Pleurodeles waltl TaxID=8319 RepID=A0AAV7T8Q1_PLEWA|nr:hypothetical protein NDU88_004829 [Pleurodeles waltl]
MPARLAVPAVAPGAPGGPLRAGQRPVDYVRWQRTSLHCPASALRRPPSSVAQVRTTYSPTPAAAPCSSGPRGRPAGVSVQPARLLTAPGFSRGSVSRVSSGLRAPTRSQCHRGPPKQPDIDRILGGPLGAPILSGRHLSHSSSPPCHT